jgi:hypothetical protein
VLTATGSIELRRVYFVCRKCRIGMHPLDRRLGVDGSTSLQAQRLMSLAGSSWSFDSASKHLNEFCGLKVSDNKIRDVCQKHGTKMARWQRETPEAHTAFREVEGNIEFTTDGTCVNTWEGWREMRVGIFSKRPPGEPATAAEWSTRKLPPTSVRLAFAAIEKCERFGTRWKRWAQRLGIADTSKISVLADGAKWIWEQVSMHFAGATGVLDIYHALEHLGETAKVLHGDGTETAGTWLDECRTKLLTGGWPSIVRQIVATRKTVTKPAEKESLEGLSTYLGNNSERLGYAGRLMEGRSIGSGQVEGACKHMIGRRLKQTGARWRVRRVNRMASLCSLLYSDHWDAYWAAN